MRKKLNRPDRINNRIKSSKQRLPFERQNQTERSNRNGYFVSAIERSFYESGCVIFIQYNIHMINVYVLQCLCFQRVFLRGIFIFLLHNLCSFRRGFLCLCM